jgi:hypothetical protein
MKSFYFLVIFSFFLLSCKATGDTQLNFLDEYVLADSIQFKNTIIGGLSGIDHVNNKYYFVVDDARNPRVLSANIVITDNKLQSVDFKNVIFFIL